MSVTPILTVPNEILNKKAEKVLKFDAETKKIIQDMLDTLIAAKNPEGAGLAAPQIGILKRIIIARRFYADPQNPNNTITKEYIFVNPKIISNSVEQELGYEACLSIPDTYGKVQRYKKVKIKAQNENGEEIRINATGFFARVIQHEIDHLEGILFTSKVIGETITEKELDKLYESSNE